MYQFTDDCLTGIEIIDNEHRRLFAMINEGIDMIHGEDKIVLAVAKDMVVQLKEYAVKHFADEEEIMEKLGDAELERQRRERQKEKSIVIPMSGCKFLSFKNFLSPRSFFYF